MTRPVNVSFQTEGASFNASLRTWQTHFKKDLGTSLRRQAMLLGRHMMRLTPPNTLSQGRAAVKRDILRAIKPLLKESFGTATDRVRKLARRRDYGKLAELLKALAERGVASAKGIQVVPFASSWHQKIRDRRGRVNKQKLRVYTADTKDLNAYIRRKMENVGRAKGGWAGGVVQLGGSAPGWVNRWRKAGHAIDMSESLYPMPYVSLVNSSEWAEGGDEQRVVSDSLKARAQAMLLDIEHAIEKAAKKAASAGGTGS